jgi:hypothetical protein
MLDGYRLAQNAVPFAAGDANVAETASQIAEVCGNVFSPPRVAKVRQLPVDAPPRVAKVRKLFRLMPIPALPTPPGANPRTKAPDPPPRDSAVVEVRLGPHSLKKVRLVN